MLCINSVTENPFPGPSTQWRIRDLSRGTITSARSANFAEREPTQGGGLGKTVPEGESFLSIFMQKRGHVQPLVLVIGEAASPPIAGSTTASTPVVSPLHLSVVHIFLLPWSVPVTVRSLHFHRSSPTPSLPESMSFSCLSVSLLRLLVV